MKNIMYINERDFELIRFRTFTIRTWALGVLDTCEACRKDCAVADDAISASTNAERYPEFSSQSPNVFNVVISMCNEPIITTNCVSP